MLADEIEKYLEKKVKQAYRKIKGKKVIVLAKGNNDLVTSDDLEIEKFLIEKFNKDYPLAHIVSEETNPQQKVGKEPCFVIDPIDGTVNFCQGFDAWGIQVAYCEDGEPISSVIYQPIRKKLYSSSKGNGVKLNGKKIEPIIFDHKKSIFLVESSQFDELERNLKNEMKMDVPSFRRIGASSISLPFLANGNVLGVLQVFPQKPWDLLPGLLMCREMGCIEKYAQDYMLIYRGQEVKDTFIPIIDKIVKWRKDLYK